MENAGSGPKIGRSLKVLRVATQSCDRFLGNIMSCQIVSHQQIKVETPISRDQSVFYHIKEIVLVGLGFMAGFIIAGIMSANGMLTGF